MVEKQKGYALFVPVALTEEDLKLLLQSLVYSLGAVVEAENAEGEPPAVPIAERYKNMQLRLRKAKEILSFEEQAEMLRNWLLGEDDD